MNIFSHPFSIKFIGMNKTWKFKLGLALIIFCVIAFLFIPVVPFLRISSGAKITFTTILFVTGEITFWTGGLLLGKELFTKYKSKMNPKNWVKTKSETKENKPD